MSDIFISYRHGKTDSWAAGRLRDTLEDHFEVYFDRSRQSNDFGDDFAQGIDEALAGCRVLFAMIGPDWASEQGLRRLQQPNDWVRRELRIALARGTDLRIVPLFHGLERAPDFSTLPDDIRLLERRNGRTLDPDDWDVETGDLVERLKRDWLAVKRGATRVTAPLPPELPYLCDRVDQEDRLVEIVRAQPLASVPIACVVHGHKWEAHDGFLDRLRYHGALDDILNAQDTGIAVHPIQLSRERLRDGRFRDALVSALKFAVLKRRTASDDDLRAYFTKLPQPLVAVVQLTASEFTEMAANPVQGLITGWRGLLDSSGGAAALPTQPVLLWINVAYEDVGAELSAEELVIPLPKLPPVESVHIREWLALDDVKARVGSKRRQFEDLPDQSQYCYAPGKIHMRTFADAVREILDAT